MDGTALRHRPVDREVELGLEVGAARGEIGDRAVGGSDAAVEAGDLEAEELDVERGRRGRAAGRAHDELADERGELLVLARQALERRLEVVAQPARRAARARRGE